ncbi:Protein NUCLEAR FUSION DEFECTIVE 4 [Coccomyxa sp. Obi]|nr:Protein NUCLEAR FUSION DEFECTIVE 4 [Coccomyxa sp. Obi]
MYINKWATNVAAIFLQICGGLCYTFSLYSPALKEAFNFTQPQLETLGSCLVSGGYFAWIPGLTYDYLRHHHKFGPRLIGAWGCLNHFIGFFMVWLAAKGYVDLPYWLLAAFALLGSSAVVFLDSAAIVTCMKNFPNERGNVGGTLKSYLGVSASLASSIYLGAYQPDGLSFLLFVAVLPLFVAVLTVPLLNHVPYIEEAEVDHGRWYMSTGSRFLATYAVAGAIVFYQLITASISEVHPYTMSQQRGIMIGVLLLLFLVLLTPIGSGGLKSRPAPLPATEDNSWRDDGGEDVESAQLLRNAGDQSAPANAGDQSKNGGRLQNNEGGMPEYTLPQCLVSLNYWMLWSALMVGMGAGFTMLNNLGQMVEALGGRREGQGIYVLLFTTLNTVGRMVGGYVPERLLHARGTPRTIFAVVASLMTCLAALLSAFTNLRWLLACAMMLGFVFGWHWSLMPVLTSELFGLHHFASNHAVMHLAPTVGGFLCSALLAGNVYDIRGTSHGDPYGTCYGRDCYRLSYLVIAGMAGLQSFASYWLFLRTREVYREEYKRLCRFEQETHAGNESAEQHSSR